MGPGTKIILLSICLKGDKLCARVEEGDVEADLVDISWGGGGGGVEGAGGGGGGEEERGGGGGGGEEVPLGVDDGGGGGVDVVGRGGW